MNIVILAAGMGKRMQSALPKVLHEIAGQPLLAHVLATARALKPCTITVIIGYQAEMVKARLSAPDLKFVLQDPPLGTGHAVQQALPYLQEDAPTLILYGDVPLLTHATLLKLCGVSEDAGADTLGILTARLAQPDGYGRIVRKDGQVQAIVEQKDASAAQCAIDEINTGILIAPTRSLQHWLRNLRNQNAQGEYYLTDIVAQAVRENMPVRTVMTDDAQEVLGVNDPAQLAELERAYQQRAAQTLMMQGVTLRDPARIDIRGELRCGKEVVIDVNCVFEGKVVLEDGVTIGANCIIKNAHIGASAKIHPFCHVEDAVVGVENVIGPYARLRAGTHLAAAVRIGNFVEVKNTRIDAHSKANHLTYLGDAVIGKEVNIGAGVITCNFDGAQKFQTIIEDRVFIGSDTQLVAPVTVGAGATIGAGTTLTKDAPAEKLTLARVHQSTISRWQRPKKDTNLKK